MAASTGRRCSTEILLEIRQQLKTAQIDGIVSPMRNRNEAIPLCFLKKTSGALRAARELGPLSLSIHSDQRYC